MYLLTVSVAIAVAVAVAKAVFVSLPVYLCICACIWPVSASVCAANSFLLLRLSSVVLGYRFSFCFQLLRNNNGANSCESAPTAAYCLTYAYGHVMAFSAGSLALCFRPKFRYTSFYYANGMQIVFGCGILMCQLYKYFRWALVLK